MQDVTDSSKRLSVSNGFIPSDGIMRVIIFRLENTRVVMRWRISSDHKVDPPGLRALVLTTLKLELGSLIVTARFIAKYE